MGRTKLNFWSSFLLFVIILLSPNCASDNATNFTPEEAFQNLQMLTGKWRVNGAEEIEEWIASTSFPIKGAIYSGKAKKKEDLSIEKIGNDIIYNAKVFNQGGGKIVGYKLISCANNEVTFQNKTHDFPSTITYKRINQNLIEGLFSGERDTQPIEMNLKLERVK